MKSYPAVFALVFTALAAIPNLAAGPNPRVDGYRGIWFTLGQYYGPGENGEAYSERRVNDPTFPYGDKYSGGLGTYTAKHTPLAIHAPEVDKTFFVYGGTPAADERRLYCMVSYFDHRTGQVPRPVIVHDKSPVADPHDNPSLAIDRDGYLWVFISGRAAQRPGFIYRSRTPHDIDAFELVHTGEITYPQPHYDSAQGFLHLFTKYTGVRELYFSHSANGHSWSADQLLAGMREPGDSRGGHYQTSATHDGVTGTFFNRHPNGDVDRRTDLYYVETPDQGRTWRTIDGQSVEIPLRDPQHASRVRVWSEENQNVYLKDMGFDEAGRPVGLYVVSPGHQPGPPNDPRYVYVSTFRDGAWAHHRICPTDHNYDMGSLYLSDEDWQVWVPSDPGPQPHHGGGEIIIWRSLDDGVTWARHQTVTHSSPRNHNYVRRPLNRSDPFFAFWTDGDPTGLSPSELYFSNSTGDQIWKLPYRMDGAFASPEPVPSTPPHSAAGAAP